MTTAQTDAANEPRLIERAFPLKQASIDSVHEKNVRHGHISTLHIWPARRPLAACRAALIATLLPDPGTPEARRRICEKIGGRVVEKVERKRMPNGRIVERVKEETEGGILHWKRETENAADLEWFRQEIRKAYGGRAPRVLDPFAGGGAIPLEAMRLGCETTAMDINPVAWFILKCTLEYPQRLAGRTHPLPDFVLDDEAFMLDFLTRAKGLSKAEAKKAYTHLGKTLKSDRPNQLPLDFDGKAGKIDLQADLAWQVRAWGQWVLNEARRELAPLYPVYADFEPLDLKGLRPYEPQPMRQVPLKPDGTADIEALNAEFSEAYLKDRLNPRWVAKPTVAYLWARTVTCKNCRATVPLLKTRWLCKKANKRVLLTMTPNAGKTGVDFGIENDVPVKGGNPAQRREHDKRLGEGTMSKAGAKCPCCGTIATMEDIRLFGQNRQIGQVLTATVCEGQSTKEFRPPKSAEIESANIESKLLSRLYQHIPYGMPEEPIPQGASRKGGGSAFTVYLYGFHKWADLFSPRQLFSIGQIVAKTREAGRALGAYRYPQEMQEAIFVGLAVGVDRIADRQSTVCRWDKGYTKLQGTFTRFALPITWDYCEGNPLSETTGNYLSNLLWVAECWDHVMAAATKSPQPTVECKSAISHDLRHYDCIVTDPPYYDAIPYSDLMDFFYIWLRRVLSGHSSRIDSLFKESLSPKWSPEHQDGELIDDGSRYDGDPQASKLAYEAGMARAFEQSAAALEPDGAFVVVFAHKHPDAWETLVAAIIRSGFVVVGSWPIQTEMGNRTRAMSSAALASSVWLVCRKRPAAARPGWDNKVIEAMRANIKARLRDFWDAGIRGPDFVWAATGPALEAYSRHPVVKKANAPGQVMGVGEFLVHVRRMVVDFVVGQVLTGERQDADMAAADRMDSPTAYYLLHRHDFGMEEAPAGACILYATACGLSDRELESTWNLLAHGGTERNGGNGTLDPDEETDADNAAASGSRVRLKSWPQRKAKAMGYEAPGGQPVPLIDRIHRLMHLWRDGDAARVDDYLDDNGLRRHELFKRLLQSLIELSTARSEERSLLEAISNHVQARGPMTARPGVLFAERTDSEVTP